MFERAETIYFCPEYRGGEKPCGLPVIIKDEVALPSTEGDLVHVKTECIIGHHLFLPLDRLLKETSP